MLELAQREALRLGKRTIDTEHILLGLLAEGDGVAAQVLKGMGADRQRKREALSDAPESMTPHWSPVGDAATRLPSDAQWKRR